MDFEQAFFEPAPIDALIQRMGRVNRAGKKPPANVTIFMKQIHPYNLYCECLSSSHEPNCRLKLTIGELQKLQNPVSEKDLVVAADRVYRNGYQGEDKIKFEEGFNHPDLDKFEQRLLAGAHQDWVEAIIEKTDGTIEILPQNLLIEYNKRKEKGLWIEADSLLVPIRTKSLAWLKSRIDMSKDPWIVGLDYTSDRGLDI
jgi:CRISPR-associated endonuclease/helicase Cas3